MRHDPISIPTSIVQGLASAPRHVVADTIAGLIEVLDRIDGDPDLELNGDELDGTGGEDDFITYHPPDCSPGCPIADPDCAADDIPIDKWEEDGV